MYSIVQLRHFQLVAREGGFTRAAELCNVTQSALSNSINGLEASLGFQLIERSKRPVSLTPQGESILARVDRLLFEARNLDKEAQNLRDGAAGTVRIGMSAIASSSFGGQIVAEWYRMFPKLHIDLVVQPTRLLVEELLDEELEFFIGDTREIRAFETELDLVPMPPQRGGAFCRSGHPLASIVSPQVSDFREYRFIATHFPPDVKKAFFDHLGVRDMLQPLIIVDCQNIATLRDAARASDLILLTTIGCVQNELESGSLVELPIGLEIYGEWSIARQKERTLHSAAPLMISKALEMANAASTTFNENGRSSLG